MPEWLRSVLLFLVIAEGLTAIYMVLLVHTFIKRSTRLLRAPLDLVSGRIEHAEGHGNWATEHGFQCLGWFVLNSGPQIPMWIWEDPTTGRTFSIYYSAMGPSYDIQTTYSATISITTGNSRGGGLFPRPPGAYLQTFPNADLDELWRRHAEAERYLVELGRLSITKQFQGFEERYARELRAQMLHLRSRPLYPLLGLYWFAVRRFQFRNRTVQEQCEKGLAKSPIEL